jgi:hypothetical protein
VFFFFFGSTGISTRPCVAKQALYHFSYATNPSFKLLKNFFLLDSVGPTCNHNTWEMEAWRLQVQGQPGLYSKTMSQRNTYFSLFFFLRWGFYYVAQSNPWALGLKWSSSSWLDGIIYMYHHAQLWTPKNLNCAFIVIFITVYSMGIMCSVLSFQLISKSQGVGKLG